MAARTCASVMGPRRYRPSWTSPANDGSPLTAATKSARSVRTIGARTARRDNASAKAARSASLERDGEQLLQLVDHDRGVEGDLAEPGHRVGTGREHHDGLAPPADGGHDAGPRQRRLAPPGRTDDGQHPCARQPADARRDVVLPPEELLGVADVVREQALVRADRRRSAGDGSARSQRRVVLQHRPFDRHEGRARIDAQLLAEQPPGPVDGPQRVGLAFRAVVRLRQQHPALLPQRLPAGQRRGQRRRFVDPTLAQQRLGQPLLGPPAQLQEPRRLVPARAPTVQLGERHALEQLERLPQQGHRPGGLADLDQLGGPLVGPLEPPGIHVVVAEGQSVPVGRGLDGPRPQRLAKPQDRALHHLPPRRRRVIAVERLGERRRGRRG